MTNLTDQPSDANRIRHSFAVLEQCVDACADYRGGRSDVFLWNARRSAEAVLYLLAENTPLATELAAQQRAHKTGHAPPVNHGELAQKLLELQQLPSHIAPYLEQVRVSGNLSLHGGSGQEAADRATLDACVRAIPVVVRWLYGESPLRRNLPQRLEKALADLESPSVRVPQEYRTEKELAHLRDQVAELTAERQLLRSRLGLQDDQPADAPIAVRRGGRWWLLLGLLVAGPVIGWWAARWLQPPVQVPCPPAQSAVAALAPAEAATPTEVGSGSGTVVDATGATDPADATQMPDTTAEPLPSEPTPADAAAAATPTVEAVAPDTVLPCGEGQVFVAASKFSLGRGPFPRPTWPQAEGKPPRAKVTAFCIDQTPVTTGDFTQWLQDDGRPFAKAWKARGSKAVPDQPVSRVAWPEADGYCRSRGGHLPTLAQWEAAVRLAAGPQIPVGMLAWSAEAFPTAALGYAAPAVCKPKGQCAWLYHQGPVPTPRDPGVRLRWQVLPSHEPPLPHLGMYCAFAVK